MPAEPSPSRLNGSLFAWNHFFQELFDRIKLGGVNERVGTGVDKCQGRRGVVATVNERQWNYPGGCSERVDIIRQPCDGVECANKDHRFDDIRLNLL